MLIFSLLEQPNVSACLAPVNEMGQATCKVWLTRRWEEKTINTGAKRPIHIYARAYLK